MGQQTATSNAQLHSVMHKVIQEFVVKNGNYRHLMPISEKVERILEVWNARPHPPGTFRTDYVFYPTGQAKLIEITCRFCAQQCL